MAGDFRKREILDEHFLTTYVIDDHNAGQRADQFLKSQYHRKSREELKRAIDEGRITVAPPVGRPDMQSKRLKPSTILNSGDILRIVAKRNKVEPVVNTAYRILFEDDDLIVLDKPGNLPVHPAGKFLFNTLVMALRKDRADWVNADEGRDFYLVHRLDRETSGVIVIGKNRDVTSDIIEQFFQRETEKRYYAIVEGSVAADSFTAEEDIGPAHGEIRLQMKAYPKGTGKVLADEMDENDQPTGIVNAETRFTVIKRANGLTLLDCHLMTGRQHQIRVHAACKGHPVVGDKLYGARPDFFLSYIEDGIITDEMRELLRLERHALHSRFLKFKHPRTGKMISVESALPEDMERLLT